MRTDNYPELTTEDVAPNHVARYLDLTALAFDRPAKVIGEFGKLKDKPGFEADLSCNRLKCSKNF